MTERNHIDFLRDKNFITWQLTGDPSLEEYWRKYRDLHPEQKNALEKAIQQFSTVELNSERLNEIEEDLLLHRIHLSIGNAVRMRSVLRFIKYASVACILITLALYFFHWNADIQDPEPFLSENITMDVNLEKEDIYLITDSKTTSFAKDVRVEIDEKGAATVQELGSGKSTIIETGMSVMNKLVVPYGKRSQLILPDGSKVWVNSGSVLEFPSTFAGDSRTINLTGEMFINVAKDRKKPFYVNTPDFQVKVYGTQFNISAYQDDAMQSIVLVSGTVGVKSVNHEETYLQPNEILLYRDQEIEKKKVDVEKYVSWKDGYIVLEQTPIAEVLKLIERYYNQSFEIKDQVDLSLRTCNGKLYLSDDLDNVMKTISILASIQYMRDGKTIYININP